MVTSSGEESICILPLFACGETLNQRTYKVIVKKLSNIF